MPSIPQLLPFTNFLMASSTSDKTTGLLREIVLEAGYIFVSSNTIDGALISYNKLAK